MQARQDESSPQSAPGDGRKGLHLLGFPTIASSATPRTQLIPLFLCGAASLLIFATAAALPNLLDSSRSFIALSLSAFALMLAGFRFCRGSGPAALVVAIAFAALFRLAMLFAPVTLSADVYRYLWDGRMTVHGVNPYRYVPSDPEIAPLRDDELYPRIGSKQYFSVYPPLAQAAFALGSWLGGSSTVPLRIMFVLFDLGCIALLFALARAAGCERRNVLLYAWNPLPIFEFAGSGHSDVLMIFFLLLAVWLLSAKRHRAGWIAFGASIAARLVPLITLPLALALFRPRRILSALLWSGLTFAVCALPFLTDLHFFVHWAQSGRLYAGGFLFNASFFALLLWLRQTFHLFSPATEIPALAMGCNALFAIIWMATVVFFWRRSERRTVRDYLTAISWLFAIYFLLTPNVQVWYTSWFVALLPLIYNTTPASHSTESERRRWLPDFLAILARPNTALLAWSCLVVLAYEGYAREEYGVPAGLLWIEYGTVVALALLQLKFTRKRNVAVVDAETRAA